MAEWLKAHAWKACGRATVSRVRIPPSPPYDFFQLVGVNHMVDSDENRRFGEVKRGELKQNLF